MRIETFIFIIIISFTFLISFIHYLLRDSNSKIANLVNRIWDEWFEVKFNSLVAFMLGIIAILILGYMFR